jgi:dethiobiotin synthetase
MNVPGIFVTGTDTGVGKSVVAAALIVSLRSRGVNAGGFKPVETGGREDSSMLREAAGAKDPLDLVNPYNFRMPVSPHQAAQEEGRTIDIAVICKAFDSLKERHEFIVAEGAGGLLVPLTPEYLVADLVAALELPLVVVARAAVGTINHTLLTVRCAQSLGLPVAGVIINHERVLAPEQAGTRPRDFTHHTRVPLLGTIPHLPDLSRETLKGAVLKYLDLSVLGAPLRAGTQPGCPPRHA